MKNLLYIISIFIALILMPAACCPALAQAPTISEELTPQASLVNTQQKKETLRVVTIIFEPFVMIKNLRYTGFCIELWEEINWVLFKTHGKWRIPRNIRQMVWLINRAMKYSYETTPKWHGFLMIRLAETVNPPEAD